MNRRTFTKKLTRQLSVGMAIATPFNSFAIAYKPQMRGMQKPKSLKAGDTVGLIAPGSSVSPEKFERALNNMAALGLKVKYTAAVKSQHGYLAATDSERLSDLHNMFADKTVDAIWCLRGGYGCTRLLPQIDFKLIKKNPKIIIGYSDITALLLGIQKKSNLIGFHGPVATSTFTDYAIQQLKSVLMDEEQNQVIKGGMFDYPSEVIRPGKARGCLTGGNLSLLAAISGTDFEMKMKNKIVFIEDIGEKPYRIDRMLTQLRQSGGLGKAAGIALGVFDGCEAKEGSNSLSLIDTLKDRLYDLDIPVYYGLPFGHVDDQCTLPVGIKVELDASNGKLTFLERAVS